MAKQALQDIRKEMFDELEQILKKGGRRPNDVFCCHPSEDRIVLSHALFWVMTQSIGGKIAKAVYLLLLRQYQEEMLAAYLTESEEFDELLRYCNLIYNTLPHLLQRTYDVRRDKMVRKLCAITVVAGGYGGSMPEEQSNELLDDMDFLYNRVKCRKIEQLLPALNKMVERELQYFE